MPRKANGHFATVDPLDHYITVPESGCWLWLGGVDPYGYGKTSGRQGTKRVSRIFFEAFVGPIPKDMLVCHKCDTPLCVNPSHLFLGSHSDNAIDREKKNRGRFRNYLPTKKRMAKYKPYKDGSINSEGLK